MRVSVDHKMGTEAGSLTISYKTLDQLDDLCALLSATIWRVQINNNTHVSV